MGVLSSLGRLIKAIFKAIWKFIKKYLLIIILIIIIVCLIYFAPLIAAWLTSVGAPTWLSTAFTWIGANITPLLSTAWSGITTVAGWAYDAFAASSAGVKTALVLGAAAALAPEETAEFLEEAGEWVADTVGTVVGSLASGLLSSPVGIAIAAGLVWYFFFRDKGEPRREIEPDDAPENDGVIGQQNGISGSDPVSLTWYGDEPTAQT